MDSFHPFTEVPATVLVAAADFHEKRAGSVALDSGCASHDERPPSFVFPIEHAGPALDKGQEFYFIRRELT
jgi:hypothetical protein